MAFTLAERFWHDRGAKPPMERGFLVDPRAHELVDSDVTSIDVHALPSCVVFLGEPGIGKTHAIEDACRVAMATRGEESVVYLDLGTIGNEYAFDRALLDHPAFVRWRGDDSVLELYLDGLDESLGQSATIAAHISRVLDRLPVQRLRLRISCRAAEWPRDLDELIRKRWPDATVRELAPLRERDVAEAATQEGVNADEFLEAIGPSAGPLAARPITLSLFLRLAREHGALPHTREALYRHGLLLLCGEANQRRRERKQVPPFTESQIFVCAARIAAGMVFGNRGEIVESMAAAANERESLYWSDVAPATERIRGEDVAITMDLVRATVSRGLFRPSGGGRARWTHRTFAEFLAAEYVRTHDLPLQQKLDLLTGPGGRVVPQLRETVAWFTDIDPRARRDLLRLDPQSVMRAEITTFSEDDRRALVDALFEFHSETPLILRDLRPSDLRKVQHDCLRDQLSVHLEGEYDVRRLAVEIIRATNDDSFADQLIDVVLDREAPFALREAALKHLIVRPPKTRIMRLVTLLPDDVGTDNGAELRGLLLGLLFPVQIDANKMFASLVPRPDDSKFRVYCDFVEKGVLSYLDDTMALAGLQWIPRRPNSHEDNKLFADLVRAVLRRAFDHATEEPFASLLPKAVASELRRSTRMVTGSVGHIGSESVRRMLVVQIMDELELTDLHALPFMFVGEVDMEWLVFRLTEASEEKKQLWAQLMFDVWSCNDARANDLVIRAAGEPAIVRVFGAILGPIDLPTPEAKRMRVKYGLSCRGPKSERPRHDRWSPLADRLANPEREWWANAVRAAWREVMDTDSTEVSVLATICSEFEPDRASALRTAAALYVHSAARVDLEDIAQGLAFIRVIAFRTALQYLGTGSVDEGTLEAWLPALIVAPDYEGVQDVGHWLGRCATSARISAFVLALFDRELEVWRYAGEPPFASVLAAERHWSEHLQSGFAERLGSDLPHPVYAVVLRLLLAKGVVEARAEAEARISAALSAGIVNESAIEAATCLTEQESDAGWSVVWPLLRQFPGIESRVLRRVLPRYSRYDLVPRLAPSEICDAAMLMLDQHGPSTPMADRLVNYLIDNGHVDEVRALLKRYPSFFRREALTMAREVRAKRDWEPPEPQAVYRIATDARRRIVRDGAHLLEIVLTALAEIQQSLRGENPQAKFLWDADRPKAENDIRDWIIERLRLQHEGLPSLIANKEVEVRKYYSDIKIEARPLGRDRGPTISVTIEVKGCWHDKLETAMRNQLLGQYLRESESPYGIYLVLWMGVETWSRDEDRRANCARWTWSEAQEFFDEQARTLTTDKVAIRAFVLDCSRA